MTSNLTVGALAEDLVARWLETQGYRLLEQRWHCRWGELDLIVQEPRSPSLHQHVEPTLVFVEVKARSRNNWDADGLLAITSQKRAKLWQTAQLFLADHPPLVDCPCRFDVALVTYRSPPDRQHARPQTLNEIPASTIQLGSFVSVGRYQFCLQHYIQAAFE